MDTLFSIQKPTFQELTLEFLTTFSLKECHISWTLLDTIQFRVYDKRFPMSYTWFTVYMGLYTDEFMDS